MRQATVADLFLIGGAAVAVTGSTLAAGLPGALIASGTTAVALGALLHAFDTDHHDQGNPR